MTREKHILHCGYCGGRHQANVCPNATPGMKSIHQIIMEEGGFNKYRAYDILQRERRLGIDSWAKRGLTRPGPSPMTEKPPAEPTNGAEHNHKRAILLALNSFEKKEARTLGRLVERMRSMGFDGSDQHNVAHVVWSLQKEGLVRFSEHKGASGRSILEHIGLRPAGRERLAEPPKKVEELPAPAFITEYQVVKPTEPEPTPWPDHIKAPVEPEPKPEPSVLDTPRPTRFPLIAALEMRGIKMNAAAKLLEEAGQDELALTILEKNVYTDFEKEVLKLWAEHRNR